VQGGEVEKSREPHHGNAIKTAPWPLTTSGGGILTFTYPRQGKLRKRLQHFQIRTAPLSSLCAAGYKLAATSEPMREGAKANQDPPPPRRGTLGGRGSWEYVMLPAFAPADPRQPSI